MLHSHLSSNKRKGLRAFRFYHCVLFNMDKIRKGAKPDVTETDGIDQGCPNGGLGLHLTHEIFFSWPMRLLCKRRPKNLIKNSQTTFTS